MYVDVSKARMKSPTIALNNSKKHVWICVKFWFISFDPKYLSNALTLYNSKNSVIREDHPTSQGVWRNITQEVQILNGGHIIFEANFRILNGSLGLDDISISLNRCERK